MRQPEPMEHVCNPRECLDLDASLSKGGPDLFQRDAGLARRERPHRLGMRLQHGTPVAADLRRRRAASLADPLHQLDRRRRAYLEPLGRSTGRGSTFNSSHDPRAQVLRQRCRHAGPHSSSPRHPESKLPIPCKPEPL
jgi:hypothetical protein